MANDLQGEWVPPHLVTDGFTYGADIIAVRLRRLPRALACALPFALTGAFPRAPVLCPPLRPHC